MLQSLMSSWRSLRDRRRLDVLDVISDSDTCEPVTVDAGLGAPGSASQVPTSR